MEIVGKIGNGNRNSNLYKRFFEQVGGKKPKVDGKAYRVLLVYVFFAFIGFFWVFLFVMGKLKK